MIRLTDSGSRRSWSEVDPIRSAKTMVTTLRATLSRAGTVERAVPQASQNRASASLSAPQAGQRGASDVPQALQNRAPGRLMRPQPGQVTIVPCCSDRPLVAALRPGTTCVNPRERLPVEKSWARTTIWYPRPARTIRRRRRDEVPVYGLGRRGGARIHDQEPARSAERRGARVRRGAPARRPFHRRQRPAARPHGHEPAHPGRQGLHHRWPLRRDEGAARRLHPHRGARPERSDPARLEDPTGPSGRHRGSPGQGAQIALSSEETVEAARRQVHAVYRSGSRRVLATLIRLLGDCDLAEEALHDAFRAAVEQWPHDGVPASPRAWLVSTGRFKAIDALRRRARFDATLGDLAERLAAA